MASDNGDIFATDYSDGLRFYTTDTIGKDRRHYWQYWDRYAKLWLPNVIVCGAVAAQSPDPPAWPWSVHYMDKDGNGLVTIVTKRKKP